jgi:hypothetical protein
VLVFFCACNERPTPLQRKKNVATAGFLEAPRFQRARRAPWNVGVFFVVTNHIHFSVKPLGEDLMLKNIAVALAAICLVSATSFAAHVSQTSPQNQIKTAAPNGTYVVSQPNTESVVDVDISGIETWNLEGSPLNTSITVDLSGPGVGSPAEITGIGWDVNQVAGLDPTAASWLSEMTIGIDYEQDGVNDLFITPSATDAPGSESNSSGGILNLAANALPNGFTTNSMINIEFFEGFEDDATTAEGLFDAGSMLSFEVVKVPEPSSLALIALAGLSLLGFRRS